MPHTWHLNTLAVKNLEFLGMREGFTSSVREEVGNYFFYRAKHFVQFYILIIAHSIHVNKNSFETNEIKKIMLILKPPVKLSRVNQSQTKGRSESKKGPSKSVAAARP